MKLLFLAAFVLLGVNQIADALEVHCTFTIDAETQEYTCEAKIVVTGDLRLIDRMVGWHLPGKSNGNVHGFNIRKQKGFKKFPRGLWKHFKKIAKIVVEETEIDEITKDDLEGLENVTDIDLSNNEITEIPDDLFVNNPFLIFLRLFGNPIKNFGENFYKLLFNLETFDISKKSCGGKSSEKSDEFSSNILKLILNQNRDCNKS